MSTYQLLLDGAPVNDAVYEALASVEVEENADLPDAVRLTLPVTVEKNDLSWVGDKRIGPYAPVAVVAAAPSGDRQCVFDGYVLSHKVRLQAGVTASTVEVWGQDASVLMGLEAKVREWSGDTDGEVANKIFRDHGFTPSGRNTDDDSPAHTDDGHTLMQRGSDIDFLRLLARRRGRWCRVTCEGEPGKRIGYFAVPSLAGDPIATINVTDPDKASTAALDFSWDVARPTKVEARQASLTDDTPEGVAGNAGDSGLKAMDARGLRSFAGRDTTVLLAAAADPAELTGRAEAVLRDAGWFSRCEGTAELDALGVVLRVGAIVTVEGVGTLLSGPYLVRRVRHTITADSHTMGFTLVRNAVGPDPAGGGAAGLLGGLL